MTYTLEPELPQTRTPCDYLRIQFDPAEVPDRRIVGLLACQRELHVRYLLMLTVEVRGSFVAGLENQGLCRLSLQRDCDS